MFFNLLTYKKLFFNLVSTVQNSIRGEMRRMRHLYISIPLSMFNPYSETTSTYSTDISISQFRVHFVPDLNTKWRNIRGIFLGKRWWSVFREIIRLPNLFYQNLNHALKRSNLRHLKCEIVWSKHPVTPGSAHGLLTSRIDAYWSTDSLDQ